MMEILSYYFPLLISLLASGFSFQYFSTVSPTAKQFYQKNQCIFSPMFKLSSPFRTQQCRIFVGQRVTPSSSTTATLFSSPNPSTEVADTRAIHSVVDAPYRYVARVMYDGTAYKGWQIQSEGFTVQGELQRVFQKRFQVDVPVIGAGRTDAGVHARGQVIHFDLPRREDNLQKLEYVMNQMLRDDIRVYNISEPPPSEQFQIEQNLPFHAIINAKSKRYTYRFYAGKCMDPLERRYRSHVYYPINIDLMQKAFPFFLGKHDFRSFSNRIESKELEMGVASGELNTERTIYSIDMTNEGDGNYKIDFYLDGALYKMVRNIMGALLAVGAEKLAPSEIPNLLKLRSREKINYVVKAAPACGLTLEKVNYNGYG